MLFSTAASLRDSPAGVSTLDRLAVAVVQTAIAIGPEVNTTPNYANRQKWVGQVFTTSEGPYAMARLMFLAVVTTAPVMTALDAGGVPLDADLAATVASLVDTFAGRS